MHYSKFILQNFRGISESVTIDLDKSNKKPLCLVGSNESGKTTILKGIELIGQLCNGKELANGDLVKCRPKRGIDFTGDIVLSAEIVFEQKDINLKQDDTFDPIKVAIKKAQGKRVEISFVYSYEISALKQQITKVSVLESNEHIDMFMKFISSLPNVIYLEDFNFDIPDFIRFPKDGYESTDDQVLNSTQNKFWQNVFDDILKGASTDKKDKQPHDAFQMTSSFSHYVTFWIRNNPGDEDAIKQRITGMSNFLNTVIQKDWEDISGLKSSFDRFGIIRKPGSESEQFEDYTIEAHEKGNVFAMSERSKGCRWFFCFKILTLIRGYRDDKKTIFLLDEPASNLHIHPQDKILLNLKKLAKTKQVIYSTHAPHLIDTENLDTCLVVDNKKVKEVDGAEISVVPFRDAAKKKKMLQPLEPIMERMTINAINPDKKKWPDVWQKLRNIDTIGNCFERIANLFG